MSKKAVLSLRDGALVIEGSGSVELDPSVSPKCFAEHFRHTQQGPFIHEVFPCLSRSAKDALVEPIEESEDLFLWWTDMRRHFASLSDGKTSRWKVADLKPVWRCFVRTWMLDDVFIAESGVAFVRTINGDILSDREFQYNTGKTILEHLQEFEEAMTYRVGLIRDVLNSELTTKEVVAANAQGEIATITISGPACIHYSQWEIPTGFTLME